MTENEMNLSKDPVPEKGDYIKGRGRVYTAGLDPEVFADRQTLIHERHTSGAEDARKAQQF